MTWAKYGTGFFTQLAEYNFPAGMEDACQLTHTQVLHYLYSTEDQSGTFLKKNLRRAASSDKAEAAAVILVDFKIWADRDSKYEIVHHAEIYKQSLGYQIKHRNRERTRKQGQRSKGKDDPPEGPDDGSDVPEGCPSGTSGGVSHPLHTYIHTYKQEAFTKRSTKQAEEETSSGASSPRKVVRVFPDCATEGCNGRLNQAAVDDGRTVCGDCVWKEGVA